MKIFGSRRMASVSAEIRELAKEKHLAPSSVLEHTGDPENPLIALAQLRNTLHSHVEKSLSAAVEIAAQAPQLASIARATTQTGHQLALSSEGIASCCEQVSTAIEVELVPSTRDVASLSARVAQAVRNCEQDSERAGASIERVSETEHQLSQVIQSLQTQLEEVVRVISSISVISKQTNLLALNAAIEAARAGEHGRGFAVVAEEVRALANHTTHATGEVAVIIESFRNQVAGLGQAGAEMQQAVGAGASSVRHMREELRQVRLAMDDLDHKVHGIASSTGQMSEAVRAINRDVHTISSEAAGIQSKASRIESLGLAVYEQSNELLHGLGCFRLALHKKAREQILAVGHHPMLVSGDKASCEAVLAQALKQLGSFELMYLVDARGTQITDNIFAGDIECTQDQINASGKSWQNRPWFYEVINQKSAHITEVYRSSATDMFCFTVSVPVFDSRGELVRVLAADARLSSLVQRLS